MRYGNKIEQDTRRRESARVVTKSDLRADVWDKTAGKCWYCGVQTNPWRDFSVDHLIPLTLGGTDEIENLAPCCRGCNNRKRDGNLERLRRTLAAIHSVVFTEQQLEFLRAQGIEVPVPRYLFYYETLNSGGVQP